MTSRVLPSAALFLLAVGCFAYALVSLQRERDLHAALALLAGGLAVRALDRTIDLLEGA
ncbi:MAG: hypothetical protein FJ096_21305 [Deltaproteobacteria bacterium]|nr:hypothetical protein [Deltaproteobacteria bacterium]